jgi:hypothetical protein
MSSGSELLELLKFRSGNRLTVRLLGAGTRSP